VVESSGQLSSHCRDLLGHVEEQMVQRDTAWPAGMPCWVDLAVDDVVKATTF